MTTPERPAKLVLSVPKFSNLATPPIESGSQTFSYFLDNCVHQRNLWNLDIDIWKLFAKVKGTHLAEMKKILMSFFSERNLWTLTFCGKWIGVRLIWSYLVHFLMPLVCGAVITNNYFQQFLGSAQFMSFWVEKEFSQIRIDWLFPRYLSNGLGSFLRNTHVQDLLLSWRWPWATESRIKFTATLFCTVPKSCVTQTASLKVSRVWNKFTVLLTNKIEQDSPGECI